MIEISRSYSGTWTNNWFWIIFRLKKNYTISKNSQEQAE